MAVYNSILGSPQVTDAMMPEQVITEILQEAPKASIMLSRARRVPMAKGKTKQPVLSALPEAYWVNGETGLKQTTNAGWENLTMVAEELATIVPIPDSLIADTDTPLWEAVKPLIAEAMGAKVDQAAIFGVDKPTSWPDDIVAGATAAKNTVTGGTGADIAVDVANLAGLVAKQGYTVNGFISEPGLNWELIGMRSGQGQPIYSPSLAQGQPDTLYGRPLDEDQTGVFDTLKAKMIALDWSKFVIGVRQDITYDLFTEGVISDASGKVILNLMQQDTKALRVVMRVGYQVAAPMTRLAKGTKKFPAGVLLPAATTTPTSGS